LDAAELMPVCAQGVTAVRMALPNAARSACGLERITVAGTASAADARHVLNTLQNDPRVEYAELRPERFTHGHPGHGETLDGVPDDPFYSQQWGMPLIQAEAGWTITRGSASVVIAVVDLGVDFSHPELTGCRWSNTAELSGVSGVDDDHNGYIDDYYGYDFMDEDGDPSPNPQAAEQSHGTHVAGLAAAARNNGRGIAGLAPDCKIMGVRAGVTTNDGGHIYYGYEGIYYACRAGAKIINCSWGGSGASAYERDVIDYVRAQGCIVVASAGNDFSADPNYPAGTEGVVSVAATELGDRAANFTNFGPWVKISAPGVNMISTVIGRDGGPSYEYYQGTSMAAPLVAAACALVASRFPTWTGQMVADRVMASADPIDARNPDKSGQLGLGRLNVYRALTDSVGGVHLGTCTVVETSGDHNGHLQGGESATLAISLYNDLRDLNGVLGRVAIRANGVSLINPTCLYGNVAVGGPFLNVSPMTLELAPSLVRGPAVDLTIDWLGESGSLVGRATTTLCVDSTFINFDNGSVALGFAENGCLGYEDYVNGRYFGAGLRISPRQNALYHGSFVLAADGRVQDNAYHNMTAIDRPDLFDFEAEPDSFVHQVPSTRADLEARASFSDFQAESPIWTHIDAAALAWRGPADNRMVILEYDATNRTVNPWQVTYAGLFLDFDLGPASSNSAMYDSAHQLLAIRQSLPGYPMVGVTAVSDRWGSLKVLGNRNVLDSYTTWNDQIKWSMLGAGMDLTIPAEPQDISLLAAVGPFQVNGHDHRTVAFALLLGSTLDELQVLADSARHKYSPAGKAAPADEPLRAVRQPRLFPNPLQAGEALQLEMAEAERAHIRFYNVLGQTVAELPDVQAGTIPRPDLAGASGLLFYTIRTSSGNTAGKILITK
jgi:hypothetical protein